MLKQLADAYYREGLALIRENRISDAVRAVLQATILDSDNWEAWNVLGLCLYQLGDFTKARRAWSGSIARLPQGNPALEYMREFEDSKFTSILHHYNEALEFARQGEYRRASTILWNKGEELPPFVNYLNLLALCLHGQGMKRKAFDIWKKSFVLDKSHPDTQRYISETAAVYGLSSLIAEFWVRFKNLFTGSRERSGI